MQSSIPTKKVVIGAVTAVILLIAGYLITHRHDKTMDQLQGLWLYEGGKLFLHPDGGGGYDGVYKGIRGIVNTPWWADEHEIEIHNVPNMPPGPRGYSILNGGSTVRFHPFENEMRRTTFAATAPLNQAPTDGRQNSTPPPPSSSVSSSAVAKAEWVMIFQKYAALMGKSREEVVKTVGPPPRSQFGGYDYVDSNFGVHIGFGGPAHTPTESQTVESLSIGIGKTSLKDIWGQLFPPGSQPSEFHSNADESLKYWAYEPHGWWGTGVEFRGEFKPGITIEIDGQIEKDEVPMWKADRTFNIKTSEYDVSPPRFNPDKDWWSINATSISVFKSSGKSDINYHPLPKEKVEKWEGD